MKSLLIFFSFLFVLTYNIYAQVDIGAKVFPLFSVNRLSSESDLARFSANGANLKLAGGATLDFFLKENYYFSTGLFFLPKSVGLSINPVDNAPTVEEDYNLQYLQIPLTLKLFTNEISLDKRLYFQVGVSSDIKIHEENKSENNVYIKNFKIIDSSLLISTGIDWRIGYTTYAYGGISYARGLFNVVGEQIDLDEKIVVKNDYLSLEIGIRF
ncbi:MAG: outer membrane beta-barrel protein [Candidatus Cyclobacteriaceae bacterium M3_2C_046]